MSLFGATAPTYRPDSDAPPADWPFIGSLLEHAFEKVANLLDLCILTFSMPPQVFPESAHGSGKPLTHRELIRFFELIGFPVSEFVEPGVRAEQSWERMCTAINDQGHDISQLEGSVAEEVCWWFVDMVTQEGGANTMCDMPLLELLCLPESCYN